MKEINAVLNKTFRANLKIVRRAMNKTSVDLSEEAGLRHKKRIADMEDGRASPDLSELVAICDALEVNMEDMLTRRATLVIQFEFIHED